MPQFVALLRGINVGGKNLMRMAELKTCLERHGFERVQTYIQSGNVLFTSAERSSALVPRIEKILTATFDYHASVVVRTQTELRAIVEQAPKGFGTQPRLYRYDVLFLKPPLSAPVALCSVPTKEGVDTAHAGAGVLYFSRLVSKAAHSRLSRVVSMPIYQQLTIRNWNTTVALLRLMDTLR